MQRFLQLIERVGNRLPDPTTLFAIGTLLVLLISHVAVVFDWRVVERRPVEVEVEIDGRQQVMVQWEETGESHSARSLLTRDGIFWALANAREHFLQFPPLGIVLVGMLGIGVAERTGFISALLRLSMQRLPPHLLTPVTILLGILSTIASDAGYIVLPPLAAMVYLSFGRSPLAGIAAAFAGVSAGFNANLMITALDPMLAGLSQEGARVIDPDYTVSPVANWFFMIASTFVLTLAGWWTSDRLVEPAIRKSHEGDSDAEPLQVQGAEPITPSETRGVIYALLALAALFALLLAAIFIPGAPLHGVVGEHLIDDIREPGATADRSRWLVIIVPLLFLGMLTPGLAYGVHQGVIKNDKDLAKLFSESIAGIAPVIVLAFFAGQFIYCFAHSGVAVMMAEAGGQALARAEMPIPMLLVTFIFMVGVFNLFIGSMSGKYAILAPIFVPMFMMVGISPELTQAAYRIGDSTTNIITPLNAYLIIVISFMQRFYPKGGLGTLVSLMLPYTIVFTIVWSIMLVIWVYFQIPLSYGTEGPLFYHFQ